MKVRDGGIRGWIYSADLGSCNVGNVENESKFLV